MNRIKNITTKAYDAVLELAIATSPSIIKNYVTHLRNRLILKEKEKEDILEQWEEVVDENKKLKLMIKKQEVLLKENNRKIKYLEALTKDLSMENRKLLLALDEELPELKAKIEIVKIKNTKVIIKKEYVTSTKNNVGDIEDNKNKKGNTARVLSPLQEIKKKLNTLA